MTNEALRRAMENTQKYWADRAEMRMELGMQAADQVASDLAKAYRNMQRQADYEVKRIFERYGNEYGLSYADAIMDINTSQYREWRMTLAEYVESINATGDQELLRELNILSARSRASRWQQVETAIKVNASELAAEQESLVRRLLEEQYKGAYYGQVYDIHKGLGFGKALEMLNSRQVAETLAYPWSGANFSERIWANKDRLTNTLRQTLTEGLIQGQDTRQMAQRIQETVGNSYRQAETLIRTETAHIIEQGTMHGYGAAKVEEYQLLIALDRRTSKICQGKDETKRYKVSEAKVGVNMPPFHPNCRTTTVAVIDEDDVEEGLRAAKDSDGGYQLVSANMTYKEWEQEFVIKPSQQKVAEQANKMYNLGSEQENVAAYKRDKPLRDRIQSDKVIKKLEPGQFKKHVPGTNEYAQYVAKLQEAGQYGPSRLTITKAEAQALINMHHGTGILTRGSRGQWLNEEVITVHPDIIGVVVNNLTGQEADTTVFKIKYGKDGTHIVPDYPSKKGAKGRK